MAAPLVSEYHTKKMLAKLGYRFDPDDLGGFEEAYLTQIASEFAKLEQDEIKKASKTRGRR